MKNLNEDRLPDSAIARLLYELRFLDRQDGKLFQPFEIEDEIILDGITSKYTELKRNMAKLSSFLKAAGRNLFPITFEVIKQKPFIGAAQIAVIFFLSDGQTITIYFHKPDRNPMRIQASDVVISWSWYLNKMNVTLTVARERGVKTKSREAAQRIMRLAEQNSALFQRKNPDLAKEARKINVLQEEIKQLAERLKVAKQTRYLAQSKAEKRANTVEIIWKAVKQFEKKKNKLNEQFKESMRISGNDLSEGAKRFFTQAFEGKNIPSVIGKIWLLTSINDNQSYRTSSKKAKLIPLIPEVIMSGRYFGKYPVQNHSNDGYIYTHYFAKKLTVDEQSVNVGVTVGEKEGGRLEYVAFGFPHRIEPSRIFGKRKTLFFDSVTKDNDSINVDVLESESLPQDMISTSNRNNKRLVESKEVVAINEKKIKDTAQYIGTLKKEEIFKYAFNYFKTELQGKIVPTSIGDVHLTGVTRTKLRMGLNRSITKGMLVPYIPLILSKGMYNGCSDVYEKRKDKFIRFHTFTYEVNLGNQNVIASLQVGERPFKDQKFSAYNLIHDNEKD